MLAMSEKKGAFAEVMIKSPNQVDDFKVKCEFSWSVERLKEHLSEVYPTKPLKSQQRIIFSGRLLPDNLLLKDVLTQDDGVYTMHLVCPHTTSSSLDAGNKTPSAANKTENVNPGTGFPYSNVMSPPVSLHPEGLRQRIPEQQIPNPSVPHYQPYPAFDSASGIPPYMAYQLAMMQQTYAQAMAQYVAQNNPGSSPNSFPPRMYGAPPMQTPPAQTPQQNAPAQPRPRNVAEENEDFDILDSMYVLTRVVMLLAVLYFYSSLGRILFVLTLALAFITFRLTAYRRTQRVPQTNVPERTNEQPPNNSEESSDAGTQDNQDTQETNTSSESSAQVPASVPSAVSVAVTFVKTFFTSLVPEQQPLTAQF